VKLEKRALACDVLLVNLAMGDRPTGSASGLGLWILPPVGGSLVNTNFADNFSGRLYFHFLAVLYSVQVGNLFFHCSSKIKRFCLCYKEN